MKRFKTIAQFASALLVSVGLVAGAAQAQTIKIGAPLALTGGLADEGKKQQIAYDMWLKRVNAQGGISVGGKKMRVEIIQYDYQTNEQRVQQLAEKLIVDDKVDFLLAPFGSGHTKVVAGVAERYGVPVLATSASSESIFNQGYKYLFGTLAPNGGSIDNLLAAVTKQFPKVKKVAILGREDVFPKSMATIMDDSAKKPACRWCRWSSTLSARLTSPRPSPRSSRSTRTGFTSPVTARIWCSRANKWPTSTSRRRSSP